jgi:thiol-disulfide isomerase/thioredoxin
LISFSSVYCFSQELNQVKFDEKANKEILFGNCDLNGLTTPPFDEWYYEEFNSYEPDIELLNNLESSGGLAGVDITIVMGTWCSDSRREVPRFYKLFENLDFNIDDIKLINVDTKKEAEGTTVSELNIERVPTFIFKRGGEEIGRIIETPDESLEADMLKIVLE